VARPDIAITTDVIVGFPGETREDFEATLALVGEVGFVDSYRFKYSPRPGTAAETMGGAVDPEEAQDRLDALHAAQRELTLQAHRARVGTVTEALVEGPSHRDRAGSGHGAQLRGRDPYHRVVNFASGEHPPGPGTIVRLAVVEATPHSLIGVAQGEARQDAPPLKEPARSADELGRRSTSAPV
jgi:tRNA-2-methylthio-N6-dimethylallyladenosine synthase